MPTYSVGTPPSAGVVDGGVEGVSVPVGVPGVVGADSVVVGFGSAPGFLWPSLPMKAYTEPPAPTATTRATAINATVPPFLWGVGSGAG